MRFVLMLLLGSLLLTGCDAFYVQLSPTEYGVRFRVLPLVLGGGLAKDVIKKGETAVVWPWDRIMRFDTRVKTLEWGAAADGSNFGQEDYVRTRAFDGNEVALAVRIEYRITDQPDQLVRMAGEIATSNQAVEEIVMRVARSDIRTYMNRLRTAEFFSNEAKFNGQNLVRSGMKERLDPYGIEILSVNLKEHRFERKLPSGEIDATYQENLNKIYKLNEETSREENQIKTIKALKKRELEEARARLFTMVEEAKGYEAQAKHRADAFLESKKNEAEAVVATGKAEAEGITQQVKALQGAGGKALLKVEIAKRLAESDPSFVTIAEGSGKNNLNLNRLDTNQLLEQIGLIEGLRPPTKPDKDQAGDPSIP